MNLESFLRQALQQMSIADAIIQAECSFDMPRDEIVAAVHAIVN